jgi:hypothetical protein
MDPFESLVKPSDPISEKMYYQLSSVLRVSDSKVLQPAVCIVVSISYIVIILDSEIC